MQFEKQAKNRVRHIVNTVHYIFRAVTTKCANCRSLNIISKISAI